MFRPTPDDVRARVREEHVEIRSRVQDVRDALRASPRATPRWEPALALCDALECHLEFEDTELVPILSEADAWGPVRAGIVDADHRAQRSMITALREDILAGARSASELVDEVSWFLGALEHDIELEEGVVFAENALGDETVVSEQTDG